MRLVDIPPYRGAGYEYNPKEGPWIRELLDNLRERGQLDGVEVEIDEGHFTDHKYETRNEEVWANLAPGFLKRVRECSESGRYDAIICHVPIDEGAFAAQFVSKIPVALALHSAVHFASFIGDRFSIIDISDQHGPRQRHLVQNYGLNHKLMSIRTINRTSTQVMRLVRQYPREERARAPEIQGIILDAVVQGINAIEKERVDTLILGFPGLELLQKEIRQGLDEKGYDEIPMVCMFTASVEMAKAMVNLGLKQAARAYPGDQLRAKPEYR